MLSLIRARLLPRMATLSTLSTSAVAECFVDTADGVRLYVRSQGTGPPLVMIPGAMGTAEVDYAHQFEGLSKDRTVISFDPRGYGKSRPPARRFTADYYHIDARDALAVADAVAGEGAPFDLMGWSDGANSAVLLAAAQPSRVRRLVVFGGNASVTAEDVEGYEATRDVEATWSPRMRAALEPVYGLAELQRMWGQACDAWGAIGDAGGDVCGAQAKTVACPTLLLHGAKDPICPLSQAQWFAANIPGIANGGGGPGGNMVVFHEGKHNIHQRFAEEFNAHVSAFLSK